MLRFLLLFCLFPVFLHAQNTAITGRVVGASDDFPLIGVTILIKGSTQGTITDFDGNFTLEKLDHAKQLTLRISYTGYDTKEIVAKPGDSLGTIKLQVGPSLDEVVITGMAISRRRNKNASVASAAPQNRSSYYAAEPQRREHYNGITENGFVNTQDRKVSTLSTDVDRASYANVRRFLAEGSLPPADAVRSEEMINYFNYDDAPPTGSDPLAFTTELAACPWNQENKILRVGLRAQDIDRGQLPAANLVFLLDVSGSMESADRLPLLKQSILLLTDQLRPVDKISIVVYAGSSGLVLPPTAGNEAIKIREALGRLSAGGSTAGSAGIELAYQTALENFVQGGNNRVILATDGDFNVGVSDQESLIKMIEEKRETGIYLTVLGFGRGNYQDGTMQELADRGNGNHAYIDGTMEAKKVLISEFGGTLVTVAKDVKVQIDFDPATVKSYRLIGYENRLLNEEDFADDTKDAGEMGAGHRVTVLYEIVPTEATGKSLGELRVRYKSPLGGASREMTQPIAGTSPGSPSNDLAWSAAIAEFAMLLRSSEYAGDLTYADCLAHARAAVGEDRRGYRADAVKLIELAEKLAR